MVFLLLLSLSLDPLVALFGTRESSPHGLYRKSVLTIESSTEWCPLGPADRMNKAKRSDIDHVCYQKPGGFDSMCFMFCYPLFACHISPVITDHVVIPDFIFSMTNNPLEPERAKMRVCPIFFPLALLRRIRRNTHPPISVCLRQSVDRNRAWGPPTFMRCPDAMVFMRLLRDSFFLFSFLGLSYMGLLACHTTPCHSMDSI